MQISRVMTDDERAFSKGDNCITIEWITYNGENLIEIGRGPGYKTMYLPWDTITYIETED